VAARPGDAGAAQRCPVDHAAAGRGHRRGVGRSSGEGIVVDGGAATADAAGAAEVDAAAGGVNCRSSPGRAPFFQVGGMCGGARGCGASRRVWRLR
jgi:hypothetical protein